MRSATIAIEPSALPLSPGRGTDSDEFLQRLHRHRLDAVAGRLGLDDHLLLGEGVDPFLGLGGGLAHNLQLQESGDDELARPLLAEFLADQLAQRVEDAGDILLSVPRPSERLSLPSPEFSLVLVSNE